MTDKHLKDLEGHDFFSDTSTLSASDEDPGDFSEPLSIATSNLEVFNLLFVTINQKKYFVNYLENNFLNYFEKNNFLKF